MSTLSAMTSRSGAASPHYDEMIATGVEVLECFWRREMCVVTCALRAS
jgi:hypothetical protein